MNLVITTENKNYLTLANLPNEKERENIKEYHEHIKHAYDMENLSYLMTWLFFAVSCIACIYCAYEKHILFTVLSLCCTLMAIGIVIFLGYKKPKETTVDDWINNNACNYLKQAITALDRTDATAYHFAKHIDVLCQLQDVSKNIIKYDVTFIHNCIKIIFYTCDDQNDIHTDTVYFHVNKQYENTALSKRMYEYDFQTMTLRKPYAKQSI